MAHSNHTTAGTAWYLRTWLGPALVALIAVVWVGGALDPWGEFPNQPQGPGMTVDELFNVQQGTQQVDRLLAGDLAGYRRVVADLPDHPPLGRIWMGLWHEGMLLISPPAKGGGALRITHCRLGSAVAFAMLIWLTGWSAGHWYGTRVGWFTSLAILTMPRLFGHAHLAALEMSVTLLYVAALLIIGQLWQPSTVPTTRQACLAGVVWGLALLTKIQGILLVVPVVLWGVLIWRWRAWRPLLLWGVTACLLFCIGWTWIWESPWSHLRSYLLTTTERAEIWVTYWGTKYRDRDVPWHYPWVIFCSTIPVGWLALGALGLGRMATDRRTLLSRESLLLGGWCFPLLLFSMPRVAVYDGERLFLMVYPLWGIFAGRGTEWLFSWISKRTRLVLGSVFVSVVCLLQGVGNVQMSPTFLSYYNLLIGGVAGAERAGFQVSYWGDGITRELLKKCQAVVPAGGTVAAAPTLATWRRVDGASVSALTFSPLLLEREIRVVPFDESAPERYLLMFPRREYIPDKWGRDSTAVAPVGYRAILEVRRSGVLLGGFYEAEPKPGK